MRWYPDRKFYIHATCFSVFFLKMLTLMHKTVTVHRCPALTAAFFIIHLFLMQISPARCESYVFGYVTDPHGAPVGDVLVSFLYTGTNEIAFSGTTDENGRYEIDATLGAEDNNELLLRPFQLRQNYPNPFNPVTTIPVTVNRTQRLSVSIFNVLGQSILTIEDRIFSPGNYSITWDGRNDSGESLGAGLYFCRIQSVSQVETIKMLMIDGGGNTSSSASIPPAPFAGRNAAYTYTVLITGDGIARYEQENVTFIAGSRLDFTVTRINDLPFKTAGNYLAVRKNEAYIPLFIKGVNMGVGIPGRHPGELAPTREQYRNWFERMGECGFNCLRIYTLNFPRFYEEFAAYNSKHEDKPLYLFQGVWLDEENPGNDLFAMSAGFDEEIEAVIDCIHGNNEIDLRRGKAYGRYETDVSRWTIGFIIGREISPTEVSTTNTLHMEDTMFSGSAVSLPEGTPSEVWAASRIDTTISYERDTYSVQRPVSFSSWPTLDPLEHPTEPDMTLEDLVSIDLETLDTSSAPGGYFASFHAYPYYPDFMSEDPGYRAYSDNEGPNNYLGYLTDLKNHYASRPLLIAEYGVPSSWGNAHDSYSGMSHGGLDEVEQGNYNNRMLKNIYDTDCGGGMLFALFDEWFKNSWITEPLGPDHERRPLFHNVTGPEQNFGLIAFDTGEPDYGFWPEVTGSGQIRLIRSASDNAFFYLEITLDQQFAEGDTLVVGYDTYRHDLGESILPDGSTVTNRAELALVISGNVAQLYVTEAYDLFGIWHGVSKPQQLYHSIASDGSPWNEVRWKNNFGENDIQDIGNLRMRDADSPATSLDAVVITENRIEIRIPWTLLQFTDPSELLVMDDDRATSERETAISDGIAVTITSGIDILTTERFVWEPWNIAPATVERDKASLEIVKNGLRSIPDNPEQQIVVTRLARP